MRGFPHRRGWVTGALANIENALGGTEMTPQKHRALTDGLRDLADALHCANAVLAQLQPWAEAGHVGVGDVTPVVESAEALLATCRQLHR